MTNFVDAVKEHWRKGSPLVVIAFQVAVAFEHRLIEISLDTRFFIVCLVGLIATLSVAEILRREPERHTGFSVEAAHQANVSLLWFSIRIVAITSVSAFSAFLFDETAIFHNVQLSQRTDSGNRAVGMVEIRPAHAPTNLAVSLSTSQASRIRFLEKAPASRNNQDPVDWTVRNDSIYGVTFTLRDFRSPQVFGCWYRLSAAGEVQVDVTATDTFIHILRRQELESYRRNALIFGGTLCVVGLSFWSYRSSWFRS